MNKRILSLLCMFMAVVAMNAKVRLPHMLCDNMVIQQDTEARLWGWAKAGKTVKVTVSWDNAQYTAKAGKDGKWLVKVKTPKASYTPLSITFDDGDQVTLSNILSGEVWVCAGQSNMEMPIKGFGGCPVNDVNKVVVDAKNHGAVRFCKIPSEMRVEPQEDALCQWREISMESVRDASATGYFFGRLMHDALNVPIGLIEANKGGTRVESWLTKENLIKHTKEPLDSAEMVKKFEWDYHRPLLWGNGTFNPILNYTVKGIIFYQGCSNVGDPGNQYSERLKLLVEQWREQFGLGEIPFYFVQIAPYWYDDINGTSSALLREQQYRASTIISNSGIVCTNDLVYPYEFTQIHPAQKQQVGERLAFQALSKTYGMKTLLCESPVYKDMMVKDGKVFLHFDNSYDAIAPFEQVEGFEVAGEDKVFYPATAQHFWQPGGGYWDEALVVKSDKVQKPVAVRYCFRNFQLGNVSNAAGLPLLPFRTDKW